ncbi:MAG: hypothetical protein NT022_00340, partial [Deltaproteobacteria bacterium]|nr:hypothetical protein [Deltaproteobacteria bacterium]
WFSKMYKERAAGRTTEAIVLWKSATETAAWKTLTRLSCRVCFPSARIRFVMSQGNEIGPTFSPVLFYVGKGPDRFEPCTRADVDLQQRYQYVALTRASDVLIVTYSKENEFIEKMIASGDDEGK